MKAHELLADASRWTKGTAARDANGNGTSDDHFATCWCAIGAINHCYDDTNQRRNMRYKLGNALNPKLYPTLVITSWNDAPERTHAEVLAVLKELDI